MSQREPSNRGDQRCWQICLKICNISFPITPSDSGRGMATEGPTHSLLGYSTPFKRNLGWPWTIVCIAELSQAPQASCPAYLACLMAPSRVLNRAPHSSTTQWKCTLWRKSHWASQKSLVPNLAKNRQAEILGKGPGEKWSLNRFFFFLCFSILLAFPQTTVIPANLDPETTHPLPWIGGSPPDGRDEASSKQQLQLFCRNTAQHHP